MFHQGLALVWKPFSHSTQPSNQTNTRHSVLDLAPATLHSIPRTRNIQQSPSGTNLACEAQIQPKHPFRVHKLHHRQLNPPKSDAAVLNPGEPAQPAPGAGSRGPSRAWGRRRGRLCIPLAAPQCPGEPREPGSAPLPLLPFSRFFRAPAAPKKPREPGTPRRARRRPDGVRCCRGPSGPRCGGGSGSSTR